MTRVSAQCWNRALPFGFVALLLAADTTRADRIVLRGGGQIRGKIIAEGTRPGRVTIVSETGKTPLNFEKNRVIQVIPEPSALDDYVVKRAKVAKSAEAQYALGLWCAEHKLADLAEVHYEAALKEDNTYAPAHQKLGHVLYGERWLNRDEQREAQGLVHYKGKWITKEEKEHREAQAELSAEQASWARRIKLLRQAVANGSEERRREAETQLMDIRDPVAVKPLVGVLGSSEENPFRTLLDRILVEIPGPEAASALVSHILFESDPEVRLSTMEQIERRKESEVVPLLVKALRATDPVLVNRAAWTLANLNAIATVPRLIPALLTTQYHVVWVPGGGSSGNNYNVSFGSMTPAPGLTPIAYTGSSIAYLTPPAIGPGVVAYGATTATLGQPANPTIVPNNTSGPRGPVPRLVPFTFQNVEVLNALAKLTGENYGYDIETWNQWLKTSYKTETAPSRRVPQP